MEKNFGLIVLVVWVRIWLRMLQIIWYQQLKNIFKKLFQNQIVPSSSNQQHAFFVLTIHAIHTHYLFNIVLSYRPTPGFLLPGFTYRPLFSLVFYSFSFQFNPYWQILENSSRYFFEISTSRAWARPISGKSIHHFLWVPIQFLYNIGAWARPISGKLAQIWMSFPEIGLCHAPKFIQSSCPKFE